MHLFVFISKDQVTTLRECYKILSKEFIIYYNVWYTDENKLNLDMILYYFFFLTTLVKKNKLFIIFWMTGYYKINSDRTESERSVSTCQPDDDPYVARGKWLSIV